MISWPSPPRPYSPAAMPQLAMIADLRLFTHCNTCLTLLSAQQIKSHSEVYSLTSPMLLYLWRRAWQPTPVLLAGESHGQRSLVGYSP